MDARDAAAPRAIDVVVVSYNSRDHLRECVAELAAAPSVRVIVVDNASSDGSLATVADLDVETIRLAENRGFGHGCNVGWRAGHAPAVLFLNPDARLDARSLRVLDSVLQERERVGAVGPNVFAGDGALACSRRYFPRLRSTYARAFFLHRVFPSCWWVDEVVRDPREYDRAAPAEWLSGSCLLVRRSVLESLGGFDECFFLYCEDMDLSARIWQLGHEVWFEPSAIAMHAGGASASRSSLLPVLAASRARYAEKHDRRLVASAQKLGIGLDALTHMIVARGGWRVRAGHARSIAALVGAPPRTAG